MLTGNHQGWNVELVYYPSSSSSGGETLIDLLLFLKSPSQSTTTSAGIEAKDHIREATRTNFVNDRVHDNLHKADEIMLVFYDEFDRIKEELRFRGTNHVWSWFKAENVIGSSHWELPVSRKAFAVFSLIPDNENDEKFVFEITKTGNESDCLSTGWFKVVNSHLASTCGYGDVKEGSFAVFFSKFPYAVPFLEASAALQLKIMTKRLVEDEEDQFQLVFLLEAFAGVNPFTYFARNDTNSPDSKRVTHFEKIYRHPRLYAKVKQCEMIKFQVYDFERTKLVSSVVFKANGYLLRWFDEDNIVSSSVWNFEEIKNSKVSYYQYRSQHFLIYESLQADVCPNGFVGWLVVFTDSKNCDLLEWWNKDFFISKGLKLEHQPPFILYANTSEQESLERLHYGGRIQISIKWQH